MLQEKEILFDDPEDHLMSSNFNYVNKLHPQSSSTISYNGPTTSASANQAEQDMILAKRLQETEQVIFKKFTLVFSRTLLFI